jgi:hypothetical protein
MQLLRGKVIATDTETGGKTRKKEFGGMDRIFRIKRQKSIVLNPDHPEYPCQKRILSGFHILL